MNGESRKLCTFSMFWGLFFDDKVTLDVLRLDEGGIKWFVSLFENDHDGIITDVSFASKDCIRLSGLGKEH